MSEQEALWAGDLGDAYTKRQHINMKATSTFFSEALRCAMIGHASNPSILELGANVGNNLLILRRLFPKAYLGGVEINKNAFEQLESAADCAWNLSITSGELLEKSGPPAWDLVFTRGVLIHVDPINLNKAFEALYHCSRRYILIAEYYSPRFEVISYRGQENALWKGPYAEKMLDLYPTIKMLDYGFVWKLDPVAPQDDITWWLLEKTE